MIEKIKKKIARIKAYKIFETGVPLTYERYSDITFNSDNVEDLKGKWIYNQEDEKVGVIKKANLVEGQELEFSGFVNKKGFQSMKLIGEGELFQFHITNHEDGTATINKVVLPQHKEVKE